jgi:hypothetical protein
MNGKVRQEHVADLGSIEGILLPSFYAGIAQDIADKVRTEVWARDSARSRIAFWQRLNERLARLSNRIDAKADAAIRGAVHAVVPMPTANEIASLEIWRHEDEIDFWIGLQRFKERQTESYRKLATQAQEQIIALGEDAAGAGRHVAEHRAEIARLTPSPSKAAS